MKDLLEVSKDDIEKFLKENMTKLNFGEYLYAVDNNQDPIEKWDKAKLKILIVFLLPGSHKTVSNSFSCLNWLCHEKYGDDIFVDNCYFVEEGNEDIYHENNIPYLFGNCSHRPVKDYDLVLVSIAILPEMFNFPRMLKYSGIPYTVEQRAKDPRIPPIIIGGASVTEAPILFGHVYDEEKNDLGSSLVDIAMHGYGEVILPTLIAKAYEYKNNEKKDLHDTNAFMEHLISRKILSHYLFYPNKYEWKYKDDNYTIESIKPKDERLPEKIQVNKLELEEWDGFPLKTFHLAGSNSNAIDIEVSSGCSGASTLCSFSVPAGVRIPTENGLERIETLVNNGKRKTEKLLPEDDEQEVAVELSTNQEIYEITLSDGYVFRCSGNHRMMKINLIEGKEEETFAKDIKEHDIFLIKLGVEHFGNLHFNDEEIGKMYSEDSLNSKVNDKIFLSDKETIQKYLKFAEENLLEPKEHSFRMDIQLLYKMVGEYVNISYPVAHKLLNKDNAFTISYGDRRVTIEQLKKESLSSMSRVHQAIATGRYFPVTVVSVNSTGNEEQTYTTVTEPSHRTCYDMLYTHNCHEATIAGNYHERSLDNVIKNLNYSRKTSAANTVGFYCVSGDTLISTRDGKKPIRDILGQEIEVETSMGYSVPRDIVYSGRKRLLKVTTERGFTITTTPEHYFKILTKKFNYEKYKPKMSVTKNSECANYVLGSKMAENLKQEIPEPFKESFESQTNAILKVMATQNSAQNRRAFMAGYIQNNGDLSKISALRTLVLTEEIPISMGWVQLQDLSVGDSLTIKRPDLHNKDEFLPFNNSIYRGYPDLDNDMPISFRTLESIGEVHSPTKEFIQEFNLNEMIFDKIVSIEDVGESDTYDILATDTADYVANDIVVGNSYNLNYYYRFMDMIKKGAEYFSRITLRNERLDVIAYAPEQLLISKKLGLDRISAPIEGFSNRLRNQFLNKNLSRETIMKAVENIYNLKIMHLKMGYIQTGYETKEDFDECISEIDEMFSIRSKKGSRTSLQMNITPLLYYTNIALRYLDRKTARMSFTSEKTFGYLIEELRKRGVRVKIHSRYSGTWIDQLLVDFGPIGTDVLVKSAEDGLEYFSKYDRFARDIVVEQLKNHGYNDPYFFCNARPQNWIFPNDYLEAVTPIVKKIWWNRTKRMNFEANLCLKTLANEDATCIGCQTCDPAHIKYMTTRKIYDENTFDDVLNSFSEGRKSTILRFVIKQSSEWYFYNRNALQHYITAQFLQAVPGLDESFFAVEGNSCQWLSSNNLNGWFSGKWVFDVSFKDKVNLEEVRKHIDEVNKKLKSCQVLAVYDDANIIKFKRESETSFLGFIQNYSVDFLKEKIANTDWTVRIADKAMGSTLTTSNKYMPELKDKILSVPYKNGALIYLVLPSYVSPYLLLSSITKRSYRNCIQDCIYQITDLTTTVDANCKCGNPLTFSLFTHDYNKLCPVCMGRNLLYNLSKR